MIAVLFIIGLVVLFVGVAGKMEGIFEVFIYLGGIVASICALVFIFGIVLITPAASIENKIEMYEAENEKVEAEIDAIVKAYIEEEKDTYESLKDVSAITLVSHFPELKSNEFVKRQLEIYYQNDGQIKELRE